MSSFLSEVASTISKRQKTSNQIELADVFIDDISEVLSANALAVGRLITGDGLSEAGRNHCRMRLEEFVRTPQVLTGSYAGALTDFYAHTQLRVAAAQFLGIPVAEMAVTIYSATERGSMQVGKILHNVLVSNHVFLKLSERLFPWDRARA